MICGPKYRKGTLICVILMFFNQWSGATPIIMFCPRLIEQLNEDAKEQGGEEFPISPLQASILLTFGAALASAICFWVI